MNFRILILIFIFSISCDSPKSNYTPKSSGNINTLTVVMENSIWESSVGDVVRESFASEFLGLPQQEPIFSLKQMPFEAFSGFTRESRNILLIKKTNKVNFALEKAKQKGVIIHLPQDVICSKEFSDDGDKKIASINNIPANWQGLDAGPKSREAFAKVVNRAKTILWNGPIGVFELKSFSSGTIELGESIIESTKNGAFSLVGGGDSVSAVKKFNFQDGVSYVSTGGGAMLESLEGKKLPGIAALSN